MAYPKYNITCNERVRKYTINIPIDVFEKAQKKAHAAGIYRVSIYFRHIIVRDVNKTETFSMEEIIEGRKESERVAPKEHSAERWAILDERNRKNTFIPRQIRRLINLFNPAQQKFDFKKKY